MENLNKKTDSVLIKMLQSKPIVLSTSSQSSHHKHAIKRSQQQPTIDASDDDDVMILDEPRRWTKKRRLLGKYEKKCSSGGEDDSGTEPGSSSSSTGTPSDGEFNCECTNDSGCDDEDDEECEEHKDHHIDELCWQLEENFKENDVSFSLQISNLKSLSISAVEFNDTERALRREKKNCFNDVKQMKKMGGGGRVYEAI